VQRGHIGIAAIAAAIEPSWPARLPTMSALPVRPSWSKPSRLNMASIAALTYNARVGRGQYCMTAEATECVREAGWRIDDIPYHRLVHDRVRENRLLFYTVASAAFVEITSDVYTRNLVEYFRGDDEIVGWLERSWERDEVRHGAALKRYVQTAWPEFDWDGAYRSFLAEFMPFCKLDQLAGTRALEMAARCVVETGTATFYRMLAEVSPEPVLRDIASKISLDEVRHYKHFYRYFLRYSENERIGRYAVLRTLWGRMGVIDSEDAYYSFKHVYLARDPGIAFDKAAYRGFRDGLKRMGREHFPYAMATKMLLKPLDLAVPLSRIVIPTTTAATRLLFRL
jgi:hypothetical protein